MDRSNVAAASGKFSTLFAAAIGSAAVVGIGSAADGSLAKTISYFVPAITLLIAGVVGEIETLAVRWWRLFTYDLEVDGMMKKYDKYLAQDGIDEAQREQVIAKRNQLLLKHIESTADRMHSRFELEGEAKAKPKASNRAANRRQNLPRVANSENSTT